MPGTEGCEEGFIIDPRMFISKPYRQCPRCRKAASFGILTICSRHYVRRCKECWHSESFPLPELRKKVLYLDQFVISNMMKVLNPNARRKKGEDDDFWRELFRAVDRLCKLQLLVCPDSEVHSEESLVSPFPAALQRMYELLSRGVTLHSGHAVELSQIYEHVQRWATEKESQPWEFDVRSIAHGDVYGWQRRLIISLNWGNVDQLAEEIREQRDAADKGMASVFQRWGKESCDFWAWFRQDARAYGKVALEPYSRSPRYRQNVIGAYPQPSITGKLDLRSRATVETLRQGLTRSGVADTELWRKTVEYLMSDAVERLPFNRIRAMLYAAIARKAAAGQKRPPTRGMVNDVRLISAYLPYCDAMFVDNECRAYLMEQPLRDELAYGCRVFSLNAKDELLSYLRNIEMSAPRGHLDTVMDVYGEDWATPYESLYQEPAT